jgi:hypothetical protein
LPCVDKSGTLPNLSALFNVSIGRRHTIVMIPKPIVIIENISLGPSILTAIVAGSWNVTLATVYTKIETDCYSHEYPSRTLLHGH